MTSLVSREENHIPHHPMYDQSCLLLIYIAAS